MNTELQHGSGNGVVFLIAAVFNMLLTMSYGALAEYAMYALVGNVIGGLIWLLFKKLADRMDRARRARVRERMKKRKALRDNN